jgi:hypothetical protein
VSETFTWANALAFIAALNTAPCYAGHCDWRLPNVKELQSIVDYGRNNPTIDPAFGPTAPAAYWSSTSYVGAPVAAWAVDFYIGDVMGNFPKNNLLFVRAVRGGS